MKFSKDTRYKFEWWVDPTGESVKYANNGMGINALGIDKRGRDTQRVMAHAWDGNKGLWNIIENDCDNDKNKDGKKKSAGTTTVGIEFVSSAHGGDKQFHKYGLTILDDNLRKDRRTSRESEEDGEEEHTSLFVSVTKNHDKKGKWIIVPAAAAAAATAKTEDDKDEDDVHDDDESSSSSLFHIVFVSCNDGSNAKYAGYTLHLGSLRQDERDGPAQWVMAATGTARVEGTAARLGTWRMDPPVDVLGDWLHPIVRGISDGKMRELKSFLQDRAGVSKPEHFVELQKEDPDCLKEFVATQIPSLKRKKFHAALDKLVAATAVAGGGEECENDNANNNGDDDDDDAPLRTAYKRIKMASSLGR